MAPFVLIITSSVIAVAVIAALRRTWRMRPEVVSPSASGLRHATIATRRRVLAAACVGVLVAAVCLLLEDALAASYGLPILLAPACFALGTVATIAVVGVPAVAPTNRREAELFSRRPWSFGPGWAYVAPAVSAAAVIVFAIAAGLTSSPTQDGTWRGFTIESEVGSSTASPYPGWFYSVPLIVVTVALFAATSAALARLSAAPLRGTAEDRAVGVLVRQRLTRFVLLAGTGSLLVYFGGALNIAGLAMGNAARGGPGGVDHTGLLLFGEVGFITGLAFGLFGAALVLAAIYTGFVAGRRATAPSAPREAPA